jgi:heat shock protein HslJ
MRTRRQHRGSSFLLVAVPVALLAVILPACGGGDGGGSSSASQDPAALEGQSWILTQYLAPDGTTQIVESGVNAEFVSGKVSGSSGCNTYNGSYEATGNTITFGAIATTQMACAPDKMATEAQYLKLLGEATTYEISGRSMSMSNADGTPTLQFSQG